MFLDYSIPSNPTLIYPTNTADITTEYDDILSDSVVIYQSIKVNTTLVGKLDEDEEDEIVGVAGKPLWVQQKDFPICPKSNKRMRFVCQLKSNGHVKTDFTNINAKERYYQQYFDEMNFWGDGDLFIFFEPTSKTACYFIQNT